MIELVLDDLWDRVAQLVSGGGTRAAAVAYVTDDSVIRFGEGDTLIVDASEIAIRSGQTSASVLLRAQKRGACVYSCPGLHAKILVIGQVVVLGSANLSRQSQKNLIEAGIVCDRPDVVSQTLRTIDAIARRSKRMTAESLRALADLPVARQRVPSRRGQRRKLGIKPPHYWLISSADDEFPGDESAVEERRQQIEAAESEGSSIGWFWWSGRSAFHRNAQAGDIVIYTELPRNDAKNGHGVVVYRHFPILEVERNAGLNPKITVYYHVDVGDEHAVTWAGFKKTMRAAGWGIDLKPTTCREIPARIALRAWDLWPTSE